MNDGHWIYSPGNVMRSAALLCLLIPGVAFAAGDGYSLEDLALDSASDLVDVCTIEPGHEHYASALAFCYGFFEGAIHYDEAISKAPGHVDLVCSPAGTTRSQAVGVVVTYLQANPQHGEEAPIDAIFRALVDKWPCPE